jgi:hypothetical protein
MTDLPILFQPEMVRGIIREIEQPGTGKTQTRRLLAEKLPHRANFLRVVGRDALFCDGDHPKADDCEDHSYPIRIKCAVGDRLYVREAWRAPQRWDATKASELQPRSMTIFFGAGGSIANQDARDDWRPNSWPLHGDPLPPWAGKLRPSIFLPRWASRITLLVEDVRVERLQDISHGDALAEGVEHESADPPFYYVPGIWPHSLTAVGVEEPSGRHAERSYLKLWDRINGAGSSAANPWVVAYTFRPFLSNIDAMETTNAA